MFCYLALPRLSKVFSYSLASSCSMPGILPSVTKASTVVEVSHWPVLATTTISESVIFSAYIEAAVCNLGQS